MDRCQNNCQAWIIAMLEQPGRPVRLLFSRMGALSGGPASMERWIDALALTMVRVLQFILN